MIYAGKVLKKENSKLRNCPLLFIPTLLLHLKMKVCVWKITSFWNFDFFPDPFLERVILAALMILSEAGQPVVRTTLITKWYLWCQLGPLPTTSPRLSLNCFLSLGLPLPSLQSTCEGVIVSLYTPRTLTPPPCLSVGQLIFSIRHFTPRTLKMTKFTTEK